MKHIRIFFLIIVGLTVILSFVILLSSAGAATNISATSSEHLAWDDTSGWWNFYDTNTVNVEGAQMTGYASSSSGEVSFDCASTPSGNVCGSSNYGICNGPGPHSSDGTCPNGDALGTLTGYAWNDVLGWISFNCNQTTHGGTDQCGTSNYYVSVDSSGVFSGWAWNDTAGWVNFNSSNPGSPSSTPFKVVTTYSATSTVATLVSDVIDTQSAGGATLNSITWKGQNNANGKAGNTYVDFQIAVSESAAGPWNFIGPSGTSVDYYGAACSTSFKGGISSSGASPDTPICFDPSQVANKRYLKYLVRLRSNLIQNDTPRIDDIILNWSK